MQENQGGGCCRTQGWDNGSQIPVEPSKRGEKWLHSDCFLGWTWENLLVGWLWGMKKWGNSRIASNNFWAWPKRKKDKAVVIWDGTYHRRSICGEKLENMLKCHSVRCISFLIPMLVSGRWGGGVVLMRWHRGTPVPLAQGVLQGCNQTTSQSCFTWGLHWDYTIHLQVYSQNCWQASDLLPTQASLQHCCTKWGLASPRARRDPTEWQGECSGWKPQSFLRNLWSVIPSPCCIIVVKSPLLSPSYIPGEKSI